jgi:hypothetical protein
MSSSMPPPTPATSMAGFLQSGLASAMNSNSSPAAPTVSGGTNGSSGNENGSRSASVSPVRPGPTYRLATQTASRRCTERSSVATRAWFASC